MAIAVVSCSNRYGSLGNWSAWAERRTHNLSGRKPRRYQLSHRVTVLIRVSLLTTECSKAIQVRQYRYGNTGTATLNKMYATDFLHSACVELNADVNFQQAALELSVDSEFLLSGRLLFMYLMTFARL